MNVSPVLHTKFLWHMRWFLNTSWLVFNVYFSNWGACTSRAPRGSQHIIHCGEVFPTIHHNIVEIMIRVFLFVPTYYSLWPRYFHTSHYCSIVEVLIRVFLFVLFIYLCYMTNMNNAISMWTIIAVNRNNNLI